MQPFMKKIIRILLALAVAAGGLLLSGLPAAAAPVTINLCASSGTLTMPDSTVVNVWGFVLNPGTCAPGLVTAANFPGVVLEVNVGDVVTINLSSALPAGHTASFELAGLPVTPLGSGVYQFTASREGTFVYQSDGDAGRQMAMGLYGALIVRPLGEAAGFASGSCSTAAGSIYGNAFDRECVLVLSAIDPNFNAAPDTYDMHAYLATYWLINGQPYPAAPAISAPVGQRLLLRYVNAGYDNTAMMLLGMHERVLARDAFPLNNPYLAATETLPAGRTEDAIATIPTTAPPSPNGFPLFNRNLHVTSGSTAAGTYNSSGGMMIFIQP
jgi:FtsP/CotA-like multicopper oxidase with cupredoxin domain